MTRPRPTASASPGRLRAALPDLIAGTSVALVLIPQSLAYAELAGMPPERGLYAATIPLLVAAPLASSPYLQTGPVAITSLLTFGALSTLAQPGSDEYVALGLLLALVVGAVRVAVGLLRAGVIAYLMSQPMLLGFVPAAAVLIVASQLPSALGVEPPAGGVLEQFVWTLAHPGAWRLTAIALAAGTLALMLGGRRLHPLFPGVLVAVAIAAAVSPLLGYRGEVVGDITVGLPPLSLDLPFAALGTLLIPGAVIALVGFAEPASIARAFAAEDRKTWDADREFVSQGAANVAAGLTGAFPVGGSFSRSSLNRLAGARTRWSGAVTGVVVLAFLPVAGLLGPLPVAVLGALVIGAALSLIELGPIFRLWPHSRPQFAVAAGTFALCLALAPRLDRAVLIGFALALVIHLVRELRIDLREWTDGDTLHLRPSGVLWFGAAQDLEDRFLRRLAQHPEARRLVIHLDGLGRIDVTGALALHTVLERARSSGLEADVEGVQPRDRRLVDGIVCPRGEPLAP